MCIYVRFNQILSDQMHSNIWSICIHASCIVDRNVKIERGSFDLVPGICEVIYLNSAVFNKLSMYHNTYGETSLLCSCLYCFQQYGSCSQGNVRIVTRLWVGQSGVEMLAGLRDFSFL